VSFADKDNVMAKKATSRVRFRSGDGFQMPFSDGSCGYGRILLDLRPLAKAGAFPARSALAGMYGSSLLIQIFRTVASKALASVESLQSVGTLLEQFLDRQQIYRGVYPIVGNLPVRPEDLDFPEYVQTFHENPGWRVSFQKGTIVADLPLDWQECEKLPKGSVSLGLVPDRVQQCINDPEFAKRLSSGDLRVDSNRKRVLALAGLNPGMSYDQMCEAVGALKATELLHHA
jgi:Immunity protein 26